VPRVLIVDDDPVSLHFLASAVSGFDCNVVAVASAAEALTAAQEAAFDVLLIDRRLPDQSGTQLLAALRRSGIHAAALATSAELDHGIEAGLRSAGFAACIAKPLTIAALHGLLRAYLPAGDAQPLGALLDDASANAATGSSADVLHALRRLFFDELTQIETDWRRDGSAIEPERLHRLRASCGFCGATRLGEAAQRLEAALRGEAANAPVLLCEFMDLCKLTRERLASAGGLVVR
jgi:two-component system OmpR family response regulator